MDLVSSLARHHRRRMLLIGCATASSAVLLTSAIAEATPAVLTSGHAYCFYFSTPTNGGMHLVAGGPRVIAAGPSNYISGENGKPQDSVVFVGCVDSAGNQDGSAYIGVPRIVLKMSGGHLHFLERVVVKNVRRLESNTKGTVTVTVNLSGTYLAKDSSTGAITGDLKVAAPGCLGRPFDLPFTGT